MKRSAGRSEEKRLLWNPAVLLAAAVGLAILFYAAFAYPFYTGLKIKGMKEVYRTISEIDLSELDEEDEEILRSLSNEKLEIVITDDRFQLVYPDKLGQTGRQGAIIERYIIPYEEDFQSEPTIDIRKNENFRIIRLRGLLTQKKGMETEAGEQGTNDYYVCIRLELRAVGELIRYTANYFCLASVLLFSLFYLLMRIKAVRLAFVPAYMREYGEGCMSCGKNMPPEEQAGKRQPGNTENAGHAGNESRGDDMKAQTEFVANVSHELKTPLAVISGQMEMLQSMGDRIDQNYYFTSIREEIDKMSKLVGNLLDLTIMEHQMEEMELREMDFSDMVKYMAQKYEALFQRNGISLSTQIEGDCMVYGNRAYLEQAVNNYIMNAFQHTPQGKKIRITLEKEAGFAKLCVYNEGSLIQPEKLGRIWNGFYMENEDGRTNLRGFRNAGLGLYFVKKIAECHHGSCEAQNVERGVEFRLKVPLME